MLTYAASTNIGSREVNEDNFMADLKDDKNACFMVADGLGGHDLGEVASEIAARTFAECFENKAADETAEDFLDRAFMSAQDNVLKKQEELSAPDKMKTTGVALLIKNNTYTMGHVGDSRCYGFYRNKVRFRTQDHSVPQMLAMAGDIKEKEIRHHPDRNRLLRVIGIPWDRKKQEISETKDLKKVQAFLLCTDGFWELVDEKTMGKLLKKSSSVQQWLDLLNEEVLKNGAGTDMDNFTAIAVWVN